MPLTTVRFGSMGQHTVQVWQMLDGDVAHPDGYAVVSYDETTSQFTIPVDMIVPERV